MKGAVAGLKGRPFGVGQPAESVVQRRGRQAGVQPGQSVPQPTLQDHLPVVAALGPGRIRRDVQPVGHPPTDVGKPRQRDGFNVGFGEGGHLSLSDANPFIFHYPQQPLKRRSRQHSEKSCGNSEQMPRTLPAEPKDHQSRIALGWVGPDIGKVRVQCHQCTTFVEADRRHAWIACASHSLIHDGDSVVAGLNKEPSKNPRKVLVQLKQHSGILPGQWRYAFLSQLGSI